MPFSRINCRIFLFITLSLLFPDNSNAQQSSLSKGVNYISKYIASGEFKDLKKTNSDLALADSIYLKGIQFYRGNYSDALLALMLATVPYNEVPVRIPLINVVLNYPLISASDSVFNLKNDNLPRYFFFDSPDNEYGDKDKLAHFFGSAFISYSSSVFDLGNLIGYFVEVFEESFKVQSSIDERDLYVNNLGNYFGKILKNNKDILPSHIFILRTLLYIHYNL